MWRTFLTCRVRTLADTCGNAKPGGPARRIDICETTRAIRFLPEVVIELQCLAVYVNRNFQTPASVVLLWANVMWRLNWIHPFFSGNGCGSRTASYLVWRAGLGFLLPGVKSIPDLIVAYREPYYAALRSADRACESDERDLSAMEYLCSSVLAQQLISFNELVALK
jgi:hypothetical protein